MLLREAKEILMKNGYNLVEDTDTWEHQRDDAEREWERSYHELKKNPNKKSTQADKDAAQNFVDTMLAKKMSVKDKIANAREFNNRPADYEEGIIDELMEKLQQKFDGDYGGTSALAGYSVEGPDVDFDGFDYIIIYQNLKSQQIKYKVSVSVNKKGYECMVEWYDVKTGQDDDVWFTSDTIKDAYNEIVSIIKEKK